MKFNNMLLDLIIIVINYKRKGASIRVSINKIYRWYLENTFFDSKQLKVVK